MRRLKPASGLKKPEEEEEEEEEETHIIYLIQYVPCLRKYRNILIKFCIMNQNIMTWHF
jgi:hypothetical protein